MSANHFQNSFPIAFLANEMAQNVGLSQDILRRFVDANHDGTISINELLSRDSRAPKSDSLSSPSDVANVYWN